MNASAAPNVTVKIKGEETQSELKTSSDDQGRFEFRDLAPGKYTLTFESIGLFWPEPSQVSLESGEHLETRAVLVYMCTFYTYAPVKNKGLPAQEPQGGITTSMGTTTIRGDMLQKLPF
jgi:hypothetical protein